MSEPKFTKGPWKIEKCQCGHPACNKYLVSAIGADGRCSLEDAQLIAAAPDMYEALTELIDIVQGILDGDYKPDSFTLQPARYAIARAEGGPSCTTI